MYRIGYISQKPYIISPNKSVSQLKTILDHNSDVFAVVVVADSHPIGLVMKIHLNDKLSQRYGFSLLINKPINSIMDQSPMFVNHDERIEDVSDKAMRRDNHRLYDHIIVLKNGVLHGIVDVRTILNHLVKFQRERSDILERYTSKLEQEDIEKREAICELKEAKKMLQLVIDTIPHAVFWKDRNSVYLGCNKKFASDAGIKKTSSIKGLTDDELPWTAKEAALFRKQDRQIMESRQSKLHIHQVQTNTKGEKRFLEKSKIVLHNSDQERCGVLCFYQDITERLQDDNERKKLEKKLSEAQKMEAIGRLAGGVAHDLNNILSGIINYPELLMMDLPSNSDLIEPLKDIKNSGERAAAVVQDLLTLARRGVVTKEIVDLGTIVRKCFGTAEFKRLKSDFPRIKLKKTIEPQLMSIEGSSVHLMKTIMNLVNNSIEAIEGSGQITIKAWNETFDSASPILHSTLSGKFVGLSVSDNGKGIAKEDINKIFEPFYTKKEMGRSGTGLGMAVVWGTVKDLNGIVDVSSKPGQGTEVTIYIPATPRSVKQKSNIILKDDLMGKGQTVLIVDDIQEQRDIASHYLKKMNYRVHSFESGENAVVFVRNHRADLLLLDMIMEPGMDGLETYMKILEIHPDQQAIITSGFSESDRVRKAQKLGVGYYLRKPYDLIELGKAVKMGLQKAC